MDDSEQSRRSDDPVTVAAPTVSGRFDAQPARLVRPLRPRLQSAARQARVAGHIVEKDYAISYVLAGICAQPALVDALVFKGGTALKKLFFQEYRFSEDLDFSAIEAPSGEDLEVALRQATAAAAELLQAYGPFTLTLKRHTERIPHPGGQEAFDLLVKFPWHPNPLCTIKIEITHDEPVLLPPERRPLIHGYDEELTGLVLCYRIEEVVAEKMRTLLQTHQKLVTRPWTRPRARDYYDLWRILGAFGDDFDREQLSSLLPRKCEHRQVGFRSLEDFFTEQLVAEAHKHWSANLGAFVRDLPPCDAVLSELKDLLPRYFSNLA